MDQDSQDWLGEFPNVQGCADACTTNSKCNFFLYGTGRRATWCWWEKTLSASCRDGEWKEDNYDFYELTRPTGNYRLVTTSRVPVICNVHVNVINM